MEKNNHFKLKTEVFVLTFSSFVSLLIGLVGMMIAVKSRSITVFVDASFSVLDAIIYYATVVVVKKLYCPPTEQFNFGFFKWEPMLLNIEALSTIVICCSGIIAAVGTFFHAEHATYFSPEIALFYAFFQFVLCCFVTFTLFVAYKKNGTEVLKENMLYWAFDCFSALMLSLGFFICLVLKKYTVTASYAHFVDPIMAIITSLFFLKVPVIDFLETLKDLLDSAGTEVELNDVSGVLDEMRQRYFSVLSGEYKIYSRKAGRILLFYVIYRVFPSATIHQTELVNDELKKKLGEKLEHISCLFIPTTQDPTGMKLLRKDFFT